MKTMKIWLGILLLIGIAQVAIPVVFSQGTAEKVAVNAEIVNAVTNTVVTEGTAVVPAAKGEAAK